MNMHYARPWPSSLAKLLCARYLVAHVAQLPVPIVSHEERMVTHVRWMLGTTSDGQSEILGWWVSSHTCDADWSEIAADLHLRGMEHLRFVDAVPEAHGAFIAETTTELEAAGRALVAGTASPALRTTLRGRLSRASQIAQGIQLTLTKAMRRSGALSTPGEVALDRLDERVQRLDRQLWSSAQPMFPRGSGSCATAR